MPASWVIPVASLAAICGVSLIFVWWWFPRAWKKGNQKEMEIFAAQRAERQRFMQAREQQQRDVESTGTEDGNAQNAQNDPGAQVAQPPKAHVYTPPKYTSY